MPGTRNATQDREQRRFAAAVKAHERAERRLVAAMNRWQKTRATLKRYDREADKRFNIGGTYDVRELAKL